MLGKTNFVGKLGAGPNSLPAEQEASGGRRAAANTKTVGSGAIHGPIFKWALLVRLPDADLISI